MRCLIFLRLSWAFNELVWAMMHLRREDGGKYLSRLYPTSPPRSTSAERGPTGGKMPPDDSRRPARPTALRLRRQASRTPPRPRTEGDAGEPVLALGWKTFIIGGRRFAKKSFARLPFRPSASSPISPESPVFPPRKMGGSSMRRS